MSEPIAVILGEEQARAFRDYFYQLAADSIASAERSAGASQRWLRKTVAAKYCGVSAGTFKEWTKRGLPCRVIGGVVLYDRAEIDKFINHNGVITK